jgi:hypothetical protein
VSEDSPCDLRVFRVSVGCPVFGNVVSERDREIRQARGPKNQLDPRVPYGFFVEKERAQDGRLVDVATVLITNRECAFTCTFCDLWVNTLDRTGPAGAVAAQVRYALERLPGARQIKLYNAGSFFDAGSIPREEWGELVELLAPFERVIVEAHPKLIGEAARELGERLGGRLEVAMGLETAHPEALARMNKKMTVEDFQEAARRLAGWGIASRAFLLLRAPGLDEDEGVEWALRSLEVVRECGVGCACVIPLRGGGVWPAPRLASLEDVLDRALAQGGPMRVFADLWDIEKISPCAACRGTRRERLQRVNDGQRPEPRVACGTCAA